MHTKAFWAVSASLLVACWSMAASAVTAGSAPTALTLAGYTDMALANSPQIATSAASEDQARAGAVSARARLLPHVQAQAGASRSGSGLLLGQRIDPATAASATLSGQQLLFDFGKGLYQARAAVRSARAASEDCRTAGAGVVLDARSAYYGYLLALRTAEAQGDMVTQSQRHLDLAQTLADIGTQPRYGVTKAQVDLANAQLGLVTAQGALALAHTQMEVIAGVDLPDSVTLLDSLEAQEPDVDLTDVERAVADRPDIRSANLHLDAARLNLWSARAALLPELDLSASYRLSGISDVQDNLSGGVSMSVPVFAGGSLKAAVDQARAGLTQASVTERADVRNAALGVKQAAIQKEEARLRIASASLAVEQSRVGLDLSRQRFASGAGGSLEVTDAEATLATARIQLAQAHYDYHLAHARLLDAMGALAPVSGQGGTP
jgi:outer membrane protein TolC